MVLNLLPGTRPKFVLSWRLIIKIIIIIITDWSDDGGPDDGSFPDTRTPTAAVLI